MIPHNRPTVGIGEEGAARRVIQSGWLAQGREVEHFEHEFCSFLGLPSGHAVAVSSGTAALFLALWALSANTKRVAFPVYSCASLRHAVGMIGASEVLLDISVESPNLDPSQIEPGEIDLAIVPHMYGIPVDLSLTSDVPIIEDCAQSIGAEVNGTPVGLQGTVGIYSFSATKLITSGGQGGMVVSKDRTLVDAIRDYREFDYRKDQERRFNFQLTDLQAAIGRMQLQRLPEFLSTRQQIFDNYSAVLPILNLVRRDQQRATSAYYRAVLQTESPREIIHLLGANGIRSIIPIEEWELLGEPLEFPNAYQMTQVTVSLPIYPTLPRGSVKSILRLLSGYFNQ